MHLRTLISVALTIGFCYQICSGNAAMVRVDTIIFQGNKKTKTAYLLRQLTFSTGDTIARSELTDAIEQSKGFLLNTGLFNEINANITNWSDADQSVEIAFEVVESWYIYPVPVMRLVDRNFNVWWTEMNRSLDRIIIGFKLLYFNFSGTNDQLKMEASFGNREKWQLKYEIPYVNKAKTMGMSVHLERNSRREVGINTVDNILEFYNPEGSFIQRSTQLGFGFRLQPKIRTTHFFNMNLRSIRVSPEVIEINPNYFLSGNTQRHIGLKYEVQFENRDNKFYPRSGFFSSVSAEKKGLGVYEDINRFIVEGRFTHYKSLGRNLILQNHLKVQSELGSKYQPYAEQGALGFGQDYLHGYELYVIDGTDFLINKNSLHLQLFEKIFKFGKIVPLENYRNLPLSVWLTFNVDFGYAHSKTLRATNPMNDRLLVGRGIGLDFVLYYKYVFQLELSQNHLAETGIFFHVRTDF